MNYGPKTTSTNCYLCYDFGDKKSYSGSGGAVSNLGSANYINRSGTSFNGTLYNYSFESNNGGRMYFPGSLANPGGIIPANKPRIISNKFTAEVWAILLTPTDGYIGYAGDTSNPSAWGWGPEATWRCLYNATGMTFQMSTVNNAWGGVIVSITQTRDDNWHHFVNVYDGSSVLFYVDGVLINSAGGISGNIATANTEHTKILYRGGNIFAAGKGYIGSYKEYAYAFTQADVTRNFNATRSRFGI